MNFDPLTPVFKDYINQYAKTGIAYNFILEGTVSNNLNQGVLNVTEGTGDITAQNSWLVTAVESSVLPAG